MTGFATLQASAARLAARFRGDQAGATAIEYALVAAGIGGTIAATVWSLGSAIKTTFYDKLLSLF